MKVVMTKGFSRIVFTWDDSLQNCDHVAIDVSDEEFDNVMANKGHEGSNVEGWTSTVKFI